jgi:hypothetical protein
MTYLQEDCNEAIHRMTAALSATLAAAQQAQGGAGAGGGWRGGRGKGVAGVCVGRVGAMAI